MGTGTPTGGTEGTGGAARVLLVEDHASFREPLAFMFGREPDLEVVAQAGSLAEARQMLAGVDLAVVDLDLPDGDGTDLIGPLRAANPRAIVLVLTATSDREAHAWAVEAGAAGVLHKTARLGEVVAAARRLLSGESLLSVEAVVELLRISDRARSRDREAHRHVGQLTPRELEVLRTLADGLSDQEISRNLHVTVGTVRNHLVSIFGKLGVNSRLQALVFALRHGAVRVGAGVRAGVRGGIPEDRPSSCPYSPEYVERSFSEVRAEGVLGRSPRQPWVGCSGTSSSMRPPRASARSRARSWAMPTCHSSTPSSPWGPSLRSASCLPASVPTTARIAASMGSPLRAARALAWRIRTSLAISATV
jgi:DNA-binding NarL/FixJ family response regulator